MGLYKICEHKGRARDRCEHAWWGSFRGKRVSLAKWTNREVRSKAEADKALDDLRAAIRAGTFDERGLDPPRETSPLTFSTFADVYKHRHVLAKGLALAGTIDYRLKPLLERFDDRPIAEIRTADVEDFVADLKKPRVVNGLEGRKLTAASINRTIGSVPDGRTCNQRSSHARRKPSWRSARASGWRRSRSAYIRSTSPPRGAFALTMT